MFQRYVLRSGFAAAVLLTVLEFPSGAQRVPVNYSVITQRKVAPDKMDAYLTFTKEQTRKVMQARLNSGGIKSWTLLKLVSPYSTGSDYNFITLVTSDKFPDLDPAASEMDPIYGKAGIARLDYIQKSRELSTPVRQQINRTLVRVGATPQTGDYVRVDYHKTPAERPAELVELEETVYAPMYKSVVEAGHGLRGWSLAVPVYPSGAESDYSFTTAQTFKDNASVGAGLGTTMEVFQKVHPNRNYMLTMERARALDKIVRMRIYHVIDRLGEPPAGTTTGY